MTPFHISITAFAVISLSMLLGMFMKGYLPEHHLTGDSRDVIKLGIGMLATLAALALGLLISSAKDTFDTINGDLRLTGSKIILLDRTLALYGPETKESRNQLRGAVQLAIDQIWLNKNNTISIERAAEEHGLDELSQNLARLSPQNDDQRRLRLLALELTGGVSETRLLIMEHLGQRSFPMPLLVLLVCWLGIIFFSFGMLAPRNRTVTIVLFVCTLSAASALFLLLELDQPFDGLIKVPSTPLQNALTYISRQ